jgi:hypothetical protein
MVVKNPDTPITLDDFEITAADLKENREADITVAEELVSRLKNISVNPEEKPFIEAAIKKLKNITGSKEIMILSSIHIRGERQGPSIDLRDKVLRELGVIDPKEDLADKIKVNQYQFDPKAGKDPKILKTNIPGISVLVSLDLPIMKAVIEQEFISNKPYIQ